jgi:hypothetical protein
MEQRLTVWLSSTPIINAVIGEKCLVQVKNHESVRKVAELKIKQLSNTVQCTHCSSPCSTIMRQIMSGRGFVDCLSIL